MINLNLKKINIKDILRAPSPFYQVVSQPEIKVGRPVFDGKNENEVVAKLQWAFSIGATTKEACYFADISTDSFYRYCNKYPEFRNRIELFQSAILFIARVNIYNALVDGNLKLSMWYLERKQPDEFSVNGSLKYQLQQKIKRIEYLQGVLMENEIDFDW
jgi:hypothetical protein